MDQVSNIILVPIDFTEQSFIGLEQAHILAKSSDAKIILLHIIKESGPIWNLFNEDEKLEVIEKIRTKLLNFVKLLVYNSSIKINTVIERGYIIDKILELEEKLNVSFIVMGTTTSDNIKKKIIGSNALRVVHEAKCPVITIKGKHYSDSCKNIILPLDLQKNTKEKVSDAVKIAKLFKSTISVVSIIGVDDEFVQNKLQNQLNQVEKFINKNNVKCTSKLIKLEECAKNRSDCLKRFISEKDGDLLVITTQDQSSFIEYYLGSFALQMIHGVGIPVMSIAPKLKRRTIFNPY